MNLKLYRVPAIVVGALVLAALAGLYAYLCTYVYLEPSLPTLAQMHHVQLKVPLRIYTADGQLLAQIGTEQRTPVRYRDVPPMVRETFLAAEDHHFFHEGGINLISILRAGVIDLIEGRKAQGGSTITMEAARNVFLTLDKTWRRKLQESFVAYELDHDFSKQDVFRLYLNVIFFGERAYGVAAAAQTYYGKTLAQLTLPEAATLAGIVQAPSLYNPVVHPHLAADRRSYVLTEMLKLGYITSAAAQAADQAPIDARLHAPRVSVHAPYVAAMVRQRMVQRYGAAAETAGYRVYTTLDGRLQNAADRAVQLGLIAYDRRHGWRGPIGRTVLARTVSPAELHTLTAQYQPIGVLRPAVVVQVGAQDAQVYVRDLGFGTIGWNGLSWAGKALADGLVGAAPKSAGDVLSRGDVVYVVWHGPTNVLLAQVPQAEAAMVALDADDGGIAALVGGFDYYISKYNRAVYAQRQPGSGFKPFYYSDALHRGYTPASTFLNAPLVVGGPGMESTWRPANDSGQFSGPVRLRVALAHSLNLVSIRVLRALGVQTVTQYVQRFGFDPKALPQNLTLALGTLETNPLQMATGYAVFANGGYQVKPFLIDRILDAHDQVIWQAKPRIACHGCSKPVQLSDLQPAASESALVAEADALRGGGAADMPPGQIAPRVISADNDYIMTSMMRSVIKFGTGVRALALNRSDIAGKTGTTNNWKDAWFNGFTPHLVASVWAGFDDDRTLGYGEEGAHVALPIWMRFMRRALQGVPQWRRPQPAGIVRLRISPQTGLLVSDENPDGIEEIFMAKHLPAGTPARPASPGQGSPDSIF
ncbi:MAG: penicillin-binding protein 1A [Steroidobacteraceae bacterium]